MLLYPTIALLHPRPSVRHSRYLCIIFNHSTASADRFSIFFIWFFHVFFSLLHHNPSNLLETLSFQSSQHPALSLHQFFFVLFFSSTLRVASTDRPTNYPHRDATTTTTAIFCLHQLQLLLVCQLPSWSFNHINSVERYKTNHQTTHATTIFTHCFRPFHTLLHSHINTTTTTIIISSIHQQHYIFSLNQVDRKENNCKP